MLSRRYRLTRVQGEVVARRGRRFEGSFFRLKVAELPKKWPSLGIVVPKRVVKTSVGRHRLKRLIARALAHEIPTLPTSKTILLTVLSIPESIDMAQLRSEFRKLVTTG